MRKSAFRSLHGLLIYVKAMSSLLPLPVPAYCAKEWGDEVGFVLLCFNLILRLVESAQYW